MLTVEVAQIQPTAREGCKLMTGQDGATSPSCFWWASGLQLSLHRENLVAFAERIDDIHILSFAKGSMNTV